MSLENLRPNIQEQMAKFVFSIFKVSTRRRRKRRLVKLPGFAREINYYIGLGYYK